MNLAEINGYKTYNSKTDSNTPGLVDIDSNPGNLNISNIDKLTQEKVNMLMSNINSTSRDILNGKTPYNAILLTLDEQIINKLGVRKIQTDEVNLSPRLLKVGDK